MQTFSVDVQQTLQGDRSGVTRMYPLGPSRTVEASKPNFQVHRLPVVVQLCEWSGTIKHHVEPLRVQRRHHGRHRSSPKLHRKKGQILI